VNILRVLSMWFLWWIFAIWQYYFSKTKPLFWFWYFQPSHLSCCWHKKSIVTPLIHDKTNMMITMWDAMKYAIHSHYTQFFETSIEISNKLHELDINSYFIFEICYFEMENLYFNFEYIYLNVKVHISTLKLLFQS